LHWAALWHEHLQRDRIESSGEAKSGCRQYQNIIGTTEGTSSSLAVT
jgi:hypothetical protein